MPSNRDDQVFHTLHQWESAIMQDQLRKRKGTKSMHTGYYAKRGPTGNVGPFSSEEIRVMILSGELPPSVQLRIAGSHFWFNAVDSAAFREVCYERYGKTNLKTKDFTGPATIAFFLYFLCWLPGFLVNYYYYRLAHKRREVTGITPKGFGMLSFMFHMNFVLLIGVLTLPLIRVAYDLIWN